MNKARQQIPAVDLAPPVPSGATREQCISVWFDLVEATDEILLANLRRSGRTPEEVQAAYRGCYAAWAAEHDRTVRRMLTEFGRCGKNHGG